LIPGVPRGILAAEKTVRLRAFFDIREPADRFEEPVVDVIVVHAGDLSGQRAPVLWLRVKLLVQPGRDGDNLTRAE